MSRAYDASAGPGRHPWSDLHVALAAAAAVVGVWAQSPTVVLVAAMAPVVVHRRGSVLLVCLLVGLFGCWRSQVEWQAATPRQTGPYAGWVTVVGDPTPLGAGLRVTVEIRGERFDAWAFGSSRRRLTDRQAGDRVYVQGQRRIATSGVHRAQLRHVVGRFDLQVVGDWHEGSHLYRTASRVRSALRRAAESAMGVTDASLFTGLVLGDDARQPPEMVEAFRASGLSHLTAVSGENVAFVVAAASPLLRRLRPWPRWVGTVGVIAWFMALTRFEPSVLRAGIMAILATSAYLLGHDTSGVRLLGCTVTALVVIDPMLVWSVGFWLSVGATAGVCVLARPLAGRLPGPAWLRFPLSVTLAAQAGVAVPSVLVFHRLPLTSLPANLLAVPVAGFVMLAGIPAGLLAAVVPRSAPVVMAPCTAGTRWVATVAYDFAAIEPSPAVAAAGWLAIAVVIGVLVVSHRWRRSTDGVPI